MSISETVASSVKRIRTAQRIPLTELSDLLAGIGQPIPVLGLRRIEQGTRRVTPDEMAAVAVALGVPPIELMGEHGSEFVGAGYQGPNETSRMTVAQLHMIVERQAALIDALNERLTALETQVGQPPTPEPNTTAETHTGGPSLTVA